jgi:hypothetical protein
MGEGKGKKIPKMVDTILYLRLYFVRKEEPMSRCLRTYSRVAQREHWCDRCFTFIEPGEQYAAQVWVYDNPKRLVVFLQHMNPPCDYPPDPHDERSEEEEEREDLPMAA